MARTGNPTDSYPGVGVAFLPPIAPADCCTFPSRAEIVAELRAAGTPFIFKGGALLVGQTEAEQVTVCQGVLPVIVDTATPIWKYDNEVILDATGVNSNPAEVWATNAASWETSTIFSECDEIGPGALDVFNFTLRQGGLPDPITNVYIYVVSDCGARNAVGFMHQVVPGP